MSFRRNGRDDMTTKWHESSHVKACIDCLMISANGAEDQDLATVERVSAGLARYGDGAEFYAYSDPDTGEFLESGFTWDSCQVCGLDLGHDYVRGSVMWHDKVTG